jgi:two-component system cell cycle sensor histidine kinase/response regulator CckA
MGDNITQPAKSAELIRAKFLREALQRHAPALSSPGETIPAAPRPITPSFAPENPELQRAYLEQLVECAPEAITILDLEYRITRLNSEFTRIFGFGPTEALGQRIDSLIVPPDRSAETRWITDLLVKGQKVVLETKRQRKDGTLLDVFISTAPIMLDGKQVALCVLYRDISEQKRAEARYRSLVQSAVYGIYRSSTEGRFFDVNPALITMLGYTSAEEVLALDPKLDVFVDPSEQARVMSEFQRGERLDNVEVRWKRKDGSAITVRLSGRVANSPEETDQVVEIIAEDITERRALENQFRQAQKMEAVGRLAGGVAHDFNNLLMVIGGYTEVLLEHTRKSNPLYPKIEAIHQATDRATTLTRQLLAFSRKQLLELKVVDLNIIVEDMERLLRPLIGENIELHTQLAPDLGRTRADAGQIEQVLMNLVVNSKDAMPNGGKLIIQSNNARMNHEDVRREYSYIQPGLYVVLSVTDTGEGMDKETQSRIFEPFFTTKEKGKGTGLGLSTVYGIIKQSGGYVLVESEPRLGTTFRIYLPRVEDALEPAGAVGVSRSQTGGSETVLLAEDEESVRQLVRETLEAKGYKVLEADNGEAALQIVSSHAGKIDMLITDVVMPGMSGRELSARLCASCPHTKVLYLSGYTEDAIVHEGVIDPDTAFLQKPFTLQMLSRKVREVLDS